MGHVTHVNEYTTHVNESCYTCKWVMSHKWITFVNKMKKMGHVYMCDMTHLQMWHSQMWFHMCEWHLWIRWVMSHMWMRNRSSMVNESSQMFERVMAHMFTDVNEVCHKYEWGIAHRSMSHVTHVCASCHTDEWVMSHKLTGHVTQTWMRHGAHVGESCHICRWVKPHRYIRHAVPMRHCNTRSVLQCVAVCWSVLQRLLGAACLTYLCDMTHRHMWHDSPNIS